MAHTAASDSDVRAILDDQDSSISTTVPIRAAATLTAWIENTCDANNVLTSAQLTEIETWLAAHFYAHADLQYSSKSTEGASGSFQVGGGGSGNLDTTMWGKTAMTLDPSG